MKKKPLDPKAKALLTAIAMAGPPNFAELPPSVARQEVDVAYDRMRIPTVPVHSIRDFVVPAAGRNIPVRVYHPGTTGTLPVMVYFHGGGWVFFHLDAYDPICTHLCIATGSIVVSVEYRLAPENKFPAATDDCLEATKWIFKNLEQWNGNPSAFFLAGDSAGANLATVTALRIRNEGGPAVRGQVLVYPVTDYLNPERGSYVEFAEDYGLTREAMKWYWDQYLASEKDADDPKVAPLAEPDLSGMPPTMVIISIYDPLRDEGMAYAQRLQEAGVEVHLSIYEDMIHGFLSYIGILPQAHQAIEEIAGWIKRHQ